MVFLLVSSAFKCCCISFILVTFHHAASPCSAYALVFYDMDVTWFQPCKFCWSWSRLLLTHWLANACMNCLSLSLRVISQKKCTVSLEIYFSSVVKFLSLYTADLTVKKSCSCFLTAHVILCSLQRNNCSYHILCNVTLFLNERPEHEVDAE